MVAISVIQRALKDVESGSPRHKETATHWIAGRTKGPDDALSLREACQHAGVSVTRVRAEAIRRVTGKEPDQVGSKTKQRFGYI